MPIVREMPEPNYVTYALYDYISIMYILYNMPYVYYIGYIVYICLKKYFTLQLKTLKELLNAWSLNVLECSVN